MYEDESESVNVMRTFKSEANKQENNSSIYDNQSKESTSIKSDKENKQAVDVYNSLPNIYQCGKKICQSTYECVCTSSDQTFEYIWYRISQFTSCPKTFLFIHKHIRDFNDVR